MPPVEFQVLVDPNLPAIVPDSISFETGGSRQQVADPDLWVYNHHGEGFGFSDPGALTSFYDDLVLGRPMPTRFVTHSLRDIDTLFAITLFLHRDVAIHPTALGIVGEVDYIHRRGLTAFGQVSDMFGQFLRLLKAYTAEANLPKREQGDRLATCVGWIREYVLKGDLPALGASWPALRVLDRGTAGFCLAECSGALLEGWVEAYRLGFLRGVLVGPEQAGRREVVASRKSHYVAFDLPQAANLLNEMEAVLGARPEWRVDGLWLFSPSGGTTIPLPQLVDVFLLV